jgi:signal transduction histidine kinase
MTRRFPLVYGLLLAVWGLIVGWQAVEHNRVRQSAKADLRKSSKDIANTLSAFIRGLQFRGAVLQERLEPVLNELVSGRTNELVKSSELISIALLNAAGEPVAAAGKPIDFEQKDILQEGERWGRTSVTFVNPVDLGASLASEGATNPTIVLPPRRDLTNSPREGGRGFPRREPRPDEARPANVPEGATPGAADRGEGDLRPRTDEDRPRRSPPPGSPPAFGGAPREGDSRPRRPPWLRWMDEKEFQSLIEKRGLHGLVLALSTETFRAVCVKDLWLRSLIGLLATVSVVGSGLAWRNLAKSSDLQIRLVRASELNLRLKEMNLAAAGLAHETRNPLNIIRGLAQIISKQPELAPEVRQKSLEILKETDRVTAQLNEFIDYSRPREVRRAAVALNSTVNEVVRALGFDLEEKAVGLHVAPDLPVIQADEQLLRQALFNLLMNAIQAAEPKGEIWVAAEKTAANEARLDIRDNGPGVPPERRTEIFKPYVTTQEKGTGLGLAVVQQIVLAHGWEIECLPNEPRGALFRLTHLRLAA